MAGERHGHGMLCVNRPLNCRRLFGPPSSVPLTAVGNGERTGYCNIHKFVSLTECILIKTQCTNNNQKTEKRTIISTIPVLNGSNKTLRSKTIVNNDKNNGTA